MLRLDQRSTAWGLIADEVCVCVCLCVCVCVRVSVFICRAKLGMRRAGKRGPPLNLETRGYKWEICWRLYACCM
jgi:hypothetical protein